MAHFPKQIRDLQKFEAPFDALKLEAMNCDSGVSEGRKHEESPTK